MSMLSFKSAQDIISRELKRMHLPSSPTDLYDPVRYILSNGGKRIRPSLVLLACDMFGQDYMKAVRAAVGIEIFHSFTLVHDDLMDNSSMRRNKPVVHVKWDPNVAILSGDTMSILASQMISDVESDVLIPVINLFNSTAIKVCEGQMIDLNFENSEKVSVSEYLNMIGLKTSVLIAASLETGALIAKAGKKDCEHIYSFGYNLGLAFQLQDDLLDVYGDQEIFGKKIGNDIINNKKTYLTINALEQAHGEQKGQLIKHLSGKDFDPEIKIRLVKSIYDDLNIKPLTERRINRYFKKALKSLEMISVSPERKEVLGNFSMSLMNRSS